MDKKTVLLASACTLLMISCSNDAELINVAETTGLQTKAFVGEADFQIVDYAGDKCIQFKNDSVFNAMLWEMNDMSEEERKFLEIVDLKKGFGSGETRQEVLRGMNFSVAKGEFCVLLGPSGSGKSTLLNIIGGIDSADSGYISINGDKLKDMSEKKLTQYRRKHLGYVFQMYNLIANLNVKENIEVGAYLSDNALDIDELLHTLGLYEHRYKLPNQLSGGQQQRVSIGRAIVKNPDILLCDEPTGALDYNTSKEILKLIEDVNKKYGNTIIMVTHNEAIKNMADHVIKLRDGAVRHNDINKNKVSAEELEW